MSGESRAVEIDIVSDPCCPWCVIGYKRLEHALESLAGEVVATIRWHAFQLNPHVPDGGTNLRAHLEAKYGTTRAQSVANREQLTGLGAALGFEFDYFEEMRTFNTLRAHQLAVWADALGKKHEIELELFLSLIHI